MCVLVFSNSQEALKKFILLIISKCIYHIKPRVPAVKPTAQKKINSTKSLLPGGIELNATLMR